MPAPPAELVAELTIEASSQSEESAQQQIETGKRVAAATGLAREAGPESIILAGSETKVFGALSEVARAALDAGARAVNVRVEVPAEARQKARGS